MSLNHGIQKYRETSRSTAKKDDKPASKLAKDTAKHEKKDENPKKSELTKKAEAANAAAAKAAASTAAKKAAAAPLKTNAKTAPAKTAPAKTTATKTVTKTATASTKSAAAAKTATSPTAKSTATAKAAATAKTAAATKPDPASEKGAKLIVTETKTKAKGSPAAEEETEEQVAAPQVGEEQLQAELEAEMKEDAVQTSTLVKEDWSPVNSTRDRLVVEYAPLIKYIAQKIAARLPTNIELDDLISSGVIGLMDAIEKYDASRDNKFKTYAEFRIRGAILDELRAQDWVPRSVREKAKVLERCYAKIEQTKGRQATDEEVCSELGISQTDYHEMLNQVRSVSLLSFDDVSNFSKADKRALHGLSDNTQGRAPTPFNEVNTAALKRMIAEAINDLPEKQRLVLSLYYYEDLNLKEIGRVLDVTESRVSQLHTQAILRLKARLRNHWDDFITLFGG